MRGVAKTFAGSSGQTIALSGVDLDVAAGEFVTLIGPSGCGKSTLLRIVAGLVEPDGGQVTVLGERPAQACEAKHIGFVPQAPALLPWRTVLDNVRLPSQVNRRAQGGDEPLDPIELLQRVGLGDALTKRPAELSGGMQQRVAIARAFVFGAPVLVMDEPFSALDELTREVLRHELLELWQAFNKTVLFVTHSVTEAVTLSDRVVVMSARPGRIQAVVPIGLGRPRPVGIEITDEFHAAEAAVRGELRAGWQHRVA
jgi:NitT/TauT family transport system ATP-binding protein